MKIVIFVFALCFIHALAEHPDFTEEQKELLKPHKEACLAETGMDEDELERIRISGSYDFSDQFKCFTACMFKRIGFQNEDGTFNEDITYSIMTQHESEAIVNKIISTCKNEVGSDTCETAGKLITCFLKTREALMPK